MFRQYTIAGGGLSVAAQGSGHFAKHRCPTRCHYQLLAWVRVLDIHETGCYLEADNDFALPAAGSSEDLGVFHLLLRRSSPERRVTGSVWMSTHFA